MADFTMKQNDRLPEITAVCLDADSQPIDLSAASSVKFLMKPSAGGAVKISSAGVITSPSAGAVKYAWGATDTDTAGSFNAEFEVTYSDGRKQTFPNDSYITISIVADLG